MRIIIDLNKAKDAIKETLDKYGIDDKEQDDITFNIIEELKKFEDD